MTDFTLLADINVGASSETDVHTVQKAENSKPLFELFFSYIHKVLAADNLQLLNMLSNTS